MRPEVKAEQKSNNSQRISSISLLTIFFLISSTQFEILVNSPYCQESCFSNVEIRFSKVSLSSSEPVFNVFLNTRKIEVPSSFRQIAMKGDHKAETIWFTLDRYFDGQDLADPSKKWAVQFINAKNEELLVPITYKYIGTQDLGTNNNPVQPNETLNEQTTLKLGWEITYDLTKESGKVQFSLRCFTVRDNNISYNLGTEMVTATIGNTLMISDTENPNIMDPPKDNLTHLVDRIEDLYKNNSLSKLSYNDLSEDTLPKIDDILLKGQHLTSADFKNISYNSCYFIRVFF